MGEGYRKHNKNQGLPSPLHDFDPSQNIAYISRQFPFILFILQHSFTVDTSYFHKFWFNSVVKIMTPSWCNRTTQYRRASNEFHEELHCGIDLYITRYLHWVNTRDKGQSSKFTGFYIQYMFWCLWIGFMCESRGGFWIPSKKRKNQISWIYIAKLSKM